MTANKANRDAGEKQREANWQTHQNELEAARANWARLKALRLERDKATTQ
jgi:hypothetical protein